MPGWYKVKTKKVTLEAFGGKDLYVVFRDVTSLPYGEARAMQKKFESLDQENPDVEMAQGILQDIIPLIVEWKMTHPQTGEDYPRPKTVNDFDDLPTDVMMHLLQQGLAVESPLPENSASTPEQPS
jgi:hypothetical protein